MGNSLRHSGGWRRQHLRQWTHWYRQSIAWSAARCHCATCYSLYLTVKFYLTDSMIHSRSTSITQYLNRGVLHSRCTSLSPSISSKLYLNHAVPHSHPVSHLSCTPMPFLYTQVPPSSSPPHFWLVTHSAYATLYVSATQAAVDRRRGLRVSTWQQRRCSDC